MPTYDYVCGNCGKEAERLVPVAQRDEQKCGTCGWSLTRESASPGIACHIEGSRLSSSRPGSRRKK